VIKTFDLRDLRQLNRLQRSSVNLDIRRSFLERQKPVRTAVKGFFTPDNLVAMTWLYRQNSAAASGYAQIHCDPLVKIWSLTSIAPEINSEDSKAVWQALLGHIARRAASHGIEQIHAHPIRNSREEETLLQNGYCRACTEQLFVLNHPLAYTKRPSDLHTFVLTGRWQLSELYRHAIPIGVRSVLQTSSYLSIEDTPLDRLSWRVSEWVAVDEESPYAYLRLTRTGAGYWLYILVRPDRRGDILDHIAYVTSIERPGNAKPLYCLIPDYAIGLSWLLRQLRFTEIQEYSHLVKQLAVRVSAPAFTNNPATALYYRDAGTPAFLSRWMMPTKGYKSSPHDKEREYALGNN